MPPRRTRRSSTSGDSPVKRTKRGEQSSVSVPQKVSTDTYTPPDKTSQKIRELIAKLTSTKSKQAQRTCQLQISVSNTEAAIIKADHGTIQEQTGSIIIISDPMEGSIDRDITITGTQGQVTHSIALISLTLKESISKSSSFDTITLNITILLPSSIVPSLTWLEESHGSSTIDLSDEYIPFSNFKSLYISDTTHNFIKIVSRLLNDISSSSYNNDDDDTQSFIDIKPEVKMPVIGTNVNIGPRPAINQKQLDKSKEAFLKYLNNEESEPQADQVIESTEVKSIAPTDPMELCKYQIQQSLQVAQSKRNLKSPIKSTVDVPVNLVAGVIGKGGSKINEMRSRSGCNISVDDLVKHGVSRTVTIVGGPEGQITALQILATLVDV